MSHKRPTIHDVAKAAGASIGSVSRVLSNSSNVSTEMRERVNNVIKQLDYHPDSSGQALRTKSSNIIACFVSDITNPLYNPIVEAIESTCRQAGYVVFIGSTRNNQRQEEELVDLLRRRRVDGAVVTIGKEHGEHIIETLRGLDIPVVIVDRDAPKDFDAVQVDHFGGGQQVTKYLLQQGHRKIALVLGSETIRPARERIDGFRSAHKDINVDFYDELIRSECNSKGVAFGETVSILEAKNRPTAIISLGSHTLAGVFGAIKNLRLSIPHDVSVVSIGDTDLARLTDPQITAISWDLYEVGRSAINLLLQRLEGRLAASPRRISVSCELILRNSVAPPPAST